MSEEREAMEFDVLIVGGGPSGLAAAIRLKQLAPDMAVCLIEKGSEIGAHILSGAVLEPRALDELIPDWRDDPPALATPAGDDRFMFLTETKAFKLPTPPAMNNHGNYIVSLGNVCRWLGAKAEALGVEIYPGFAASETIIEDGQVRGVVAGVMGIGRDGEKGPNYQPGMELRASYTLFAEGCRGSLTKKLFETFNLRDGAAPQTFGLGIKELWEIPKEKHQPGLIWHSVGWPLNTDTYGGSWLYMLGDNLVSIGFVVGLDYQNPWLSPFEEFQRFKQHPAVRAMLESKGNSGPSAATSIMKNAGTSWMQLRHELTLEIMGHQGLGWEGDTFKPEELGAVRGWLGGKAFTIYGGSQEVQSNIISKRILGLPDLTQHN